MVIDEHNAGLYYALLKQLPFSGTMSPEAYDAAIDSINIQWRVGKRGLPPPNFAPAKGVASSSAGLPAPALGRIASSGGNGASK